MTQSKKGQNALVESKVFEQTVNVYGDTIENMDIESEHKIIKQNFRKIK